MAVKQAKVRKRAEGLGRERKKSKMLRIERRMKRRSRAVRGDPRITRTKDHTSCLSSEGREKEYLMRRL
jgi:hypothetical protein